jgi:YegS/Rv2252/BmrU family lipid kinase
MTFTDKTMLLILNPTAGRYRRGLLNAVVRRVRAAGWRVDVVETRAPGDARRLAEACDAACHAVITVAGGDGTINEVINALARRGRSAPALGIVPLGTANVLAHELGVGFSAASIAATMMGGHEVLVHPGEATNGSSDARCFSLMAGAGFDAKVVAGVSARFKRRWGRLAYVWRSLIETARYRPVRYAVEVDGVRHEASSVIVTRSRHYAGPYVLAPGAALGKALLHVCLFECWGRSQALRYGLALLLGRLPGSGGYRIVTGLDVRVSVLSDAGENGRQPVQIDGDDAMTLPVSIGLAAGVVRVLRPA